MPSSDSSGPSPPPPSSPESPGGPPGLGRTGRPGGRDTPPKPRASPSASWSCLSQAWALPAFFSLFRFCIDFVARTWMWRENGRILNLEWQTLLGQHHATSSSCLQLFSQNLQKITHHHVTWAPKQEIQIQNRWTTFVALSFPHLIYLHLFSLFSTCDMFRRSWWFSRRGLTPLAFLNRVLVSLIHMVTQIKMFWFSECCCKPTPYKKCNSQSCSKANMEPTWQHSWNLSGKDGFSANGLVGPDCLASYSVTTRLRKTTWDGDGTCSNKWRVKGVMCIERCKGCPEAHLYYVLRLWT